VLSPVSIQGMGTAVPPHRVGGDEVLRLITEMEIGDHCVFGAHVGMENEILGVGISDLNVTDASGYLSTMLIRRKPVDSRHPTAASADKQEPVVNRDVFKKTSA